MFWSLFSGGAVGRCQAAQLVETGGACSPSGACGGDPSAGAQGRVGPRQGVGWGSDVGGGVVQDEVVDVDQFALQKHRRGGIVNVRPGAESVGDGACGEPLVEACDGVLRLRQIESRRVDGTGRHKSK